VTGAVALPTRADGAEERRVTHCCGQHHPVLGEASRCACCPECVTNALLGTFDAEARRVAAQWVREQRVWWRRRVLAVARLLGVADYWAVYEATAHAVRVLAPIDPPMHGRLT
jgi:hypothetical protein